MEHKEVSIAPACASCASDQPPAKAPAEIVYRIDNMDCPTEEGLIRRKLEGMSGVKALEFNLMQRTLAVTHELPSGASLEKALADIGMNAEPLLQIAGATKTVLAIPKMDCPTEEGLIRAKLKDMPGIAGLEFNLVRRSLTLTHEPAALQPALAALAAEIWDRGNAYFPPTSFQISNIAAGEGITNVIPGELRALFNFRFSTAVTAAQLQARTTAILDRHGLEYDLDWQLSGEPFLTPVGDLVNAVVGAVHDRTGTHTELSTGGGTSDGRFIASLGTQVVELGVINASIHKVDEQVAIADLESLSGIYLGLLERLLLAR